MSQTFSSVKKSGRDIRARTLMPLRGPVDPTKGCVTSKSDDLVHMPGTGWVVLGKLFMFLNFSAFINKIGILTMPML